MNHDRNTAPRQYAQLNLPFQHDPQSVRERLEAYTGRKIVLAFTDNAASMLTTRQKDGRTHLRLHNIFLHADERVLEAIAGFIGGDRSRRHMICDHIVHNSCHIRSRPAAKTPLTPGGRHHCLAEIADRVNQRYFGSRITAGITWGRRRSRRRVRRTTLGSYCRTSHIIRISPLLDRRNVPVYFLEFIVYHEMLHADLGFGELDGRRRLHTKEFRRREKLFDGYEQALAWEKSNL